VSGVYLQQIAAQNAQWLTERQSLVAGNVANASTPGYRARDLPAFSSLLDASEIAMTTTNAAHLTASPAEPGATRVIETEPGDETLSGNTVSLEQQMMALGDINRAFTLNADIRRVFHQMLLAALK
jgi:flagellar basal-body rod protein FlgB